MHEDADLGGNVLLAASIAMAGHSVIRRQVLNAVYCSQIATFLSEHISIVLCTDRI